MPKIAVLMAVYNGRSYIEEQLQSIDRQKDVDVSLFISVDVSTDGSYEWCHDYAQNHKQIKVLPYGDKFGGAAPNFFRLIQDVDFSNFDYIALADQDDIWLEDKLFKASQRLKINGFDGYSSNVFAFWDDGREVFIDKAQPQRKYDYLFEAAGPGCTYVMTVPPLIEFKKTLLSKKQQIKQVALHDWLIYAFFRKNGYRWFIEHAPTMRYRQHSRNQVGVNKGWAARLKRFQLFKSGWYKGQIKIISRVLNTESVTGSRWTILKNLNQSRRQIRDRIFLFFTVIIGLY